MQRCNEQVSTGGQAALPVQSSLALEHRACSGLRVRRQRSQLGTNKHSIKVWRARLHEFDGRIDGWLKVNFTRVEQPHEHDR
jgi:hypothetical protein